MGIRSDYLVFAGIFAATLLLTGAYTYSAWDLPTTDHGITLAGLQMDFFIALGTTLLAGIVFFISVLAFGRDRRIRYLFVSGAFFLFMIEGILLAFEALTNREWLEPAAHILNLGILLLLFAGLMKNTSS